jgi:ribose transport system ATP-binding protein
LHKSFPGVHALNDVSLEIAPGEVHGVVGQNGAGKSTLVKILAGVDNADSGVIELDGTACSFKRPIDAQLAGIYTVYQEFSQFPYLSAAENLYVSGLPRRSWGAVDWKRVRREAREALGRLGFSFDVTQPVGTLPVAHRQAVEIAKALRHNARVILLDEPTATLLRSEAQRLFELVRQLQGDGMSFVYISHRMDELYELCQRVSVFRDGRRTGTFGIPETPTGEIVRAMLGRLAEQPSADGEAQMAPARPIGRRTPDPTAAVAYQVTDLSDGKLLDGINLTLRRGEVLGVTGLAGNGQAELAACLFGARRAITGEFVVQGEKCRLKTPADAIKRRIGLIPEDRKDQALVLRMDVATNMTLASLDDFTRFGAVSRRREMSTARSYQQALSIKATSVRQPVGELSGGNQQKVILGKWLCAGSRILILDEPTRGIDVAARAQIYALVGEFVAGGGSVILITSDLEEALRCDRVAVMRRGKLVGEVDGDVLEADGEAAVLAAIAE